MPDDPTSERQPREHAVNCRRCTGQTWNHSAICDRCTAAGKLPTYQPTGPVVDNVEVRTGRLACCGAGTDRRDPRTTERLHLPGCAVLAAGGLDLVRQSLQGAR